MRFWKRLVDPDGEGIYHVSTSSGYTLITAGVLIPAMQLDDLLNYDTLSSLSQICRLSPSSQAYARR
jgi:hypothetical protein